MVAAGLAGTAIAGVAAAWACVPTGGGSSSRTVTVTPSRVQPGDQVAIGVAGPGAAEPVEIRLDGVRGPLLASVPVTGAPATANVDIPLDVEPGQHVVIAVEGAKRSAPVLLEVAGPDGVVPAVSYSQVDDRPGRSARTPVLFVAGAVAAVGLPVALGLRARRRSRERQAPRTPGVVHPVR